MRLLIVFFIFVSSLSFLNADKLERGFSRESQRLNGLTVKVEKVDGEELLAVYKKTGETLIKLMEVKDIYLSRYPLFVDGKIKEEKMALVFDIDLLYVHVLYEKENGIWIKKKESIFCRMNTRRRQKLCSVDCIDLNTVKITSLKSGEEFMHPRQDGSYRKNKGVIEQDDHVDEYKFNDDGSVTLNGESYNFEIQ